MAAKKRIEDNIVTFGMTADPAVVEGLIGTLKTILKNRARNTGGTATVEPKPRKTRTSKANGVNVATTSEVAAAAAGETTEPWA